jgi:hypothetical protein
MLAATWHESCSFKSARTLYSVVFVKLLWTGQSYYISSTYLLGFIRAVMMPAM